MDEKLKLLIEYYADEIATLQQLINEELDKEENYLAASWYQPGLSMAQNEHSKLNNFNEPYYSEKERLLKKISSIKKKLSATKEGDDNYLSFYTLLQFMEEEYQSLALKTLPEVTHPQPHLFNQAIDKVFNREIKGVNLIINQEIGLRFEVSRKRNLVIVTIPSLIRRRKTTWFYEYELKRLEQFGFEVKKQPMRLVKFFQLKLKEEATNMKTFLARCYFEVLYPYPVQNLGYIEYVY